VSGYRVHIVYLWLPSVELAIERVARRVRSGGHDIPEDSIRRRYESGLKNLFQLYFPIADSWHVYDASGTAPILVAFGDKLEGVTIVDELKWKLIER
jgi:predicted ABC-type ATPase